MNQFPPGFDFPLKRTRSYPGVENPFYRGNKKIPPFTEHILESQGGWIFSSLKFQALICSLNCVL